MYVSMYFDFYLWNEMKIKLELPKTLWKHFHRLAMLTRRKSNNSL